MARKASSLFLSMLVAVVGTAVLFSWRDISTATADTLFLPPTYVSGPITQTTTWTAANSPYVILGSVLVPSGITLTIESDVIVKVDVASGLYFTSLQVEGTLLAQGTALEPIYFTSLRDDAIGGDTNGDGNATVPAHGDWYYIYLNNGGQAQLDYVHNRYGGQNFTTQYGAYRVANNSSLILNNSVITETKTNGIWVNSAAVTVTNSLIANGNSNGIRSDNANVSITGSTIQNFSSDGVWARGNDGISSIFLDSNTITANGSDGIEFVPTGMFQPTATNNILTNNGQTPILVNYSNGGGLPILNNNIASCNGHHQGLGIAGAMTISTTLPANPNLDYVFQSPDIVSGAVLTIDPGNIIKVAIGTDIYILGGTLLAQGTASNPIYFTSLRDDAIGGDTNGDGNATIPARGNWYYIYLNNGGQAQLDYVHNRYGGENFTTQYGAYRVANNSSLILNNSVITETKTNGIWVNSASVTVTNSLIANGNSNGIGGYDTDLFVSNSTIQNVNGNGIWVQGNDSTSSVLLDSNTITANGSDGIEFVPTGLFQPIASNNTLTNNGQTPVLVNYSNGGGLPILNNNNASGNGHHQGLGIAGSMTISTTLPANPNLDYVFQVPDIKSGATLTVDPGVIIKVDIASGLYFTYILVEGTLIAQGTALDPIYFTSLHDDAIGGDTNGDGGATSPARGDWYHIYLNSGGQAQLDYVHNRYGGQNFTTPYGAYRVDGNSSLRAAGKHGYVRPETGKVP